MAQTQDDVIMHDAMMELLEASPSQLATTFPPNAKSWPYSFRPARPKRPSACSSPMSRSNACRIKMWRSTTNGRKLILVVKRPSPSSTPSSCSPAKPWAWW